MAIIDEIIANKRAEIAANKERRPLAQLQRTLAENEEAAARPSNRLREALRSRDFSIIAEIKRRSPSHGQLIDPATDIREIARSYDASPAVAGISVLTDSRYFGGALEDLGQVASVTSKPLLRKDFIVDEYQLYEARLVGAAAALLITTVLNAEDLVRLIRTARTLGLDALIECHSREDLRRIPWDEAEIIGINSRDMRGDLETNLEVFRNIYAHVPAGKIVVAESGIRSASELAAVRELGMHAALIGAGLLGSENIDAALTMLGEAACG